MEKLSLEGVFPALVPTEFQPKEGLFTATPWPHWRATAVGFCYRNGGTNALSWITHAEAEYNRWRPMSLLNESMVRLQGMLGIRDLCRLDGNTAILRIDSLDPACPIICYGAAILMPLRVIEATTALKELLGLRKSTSLPLITQPTSDQLLIGFDRDALFRWSSLMSSSNQQQWLTVSLRARSARFELEEVPLISELPSESPRRAVASA